MARQRIGNRRHVAKALRHTGELDANGQPIPTGWTKTVVDAWPCEILTTTGGERIRGRQVSASTTHVFFGEYFGGQAIGPTMRVVCQGVPYEVVSAYDPDGDGRELRVEAKRDQL